jgi:hypothetical protein
MGTKVGSLWRVVKSFERDREILTWSDRICHCLLRYQPKPQRLPISVATGVGCRTGYGLKAVT